jgi:hypothetical protein
LTCELAKWDEADGDTLVVTFFADERPLRGAAGLADWRLCGRLSRLIKHQRVSGAMGEALMMPPGRRLPFRLMVLFGLGPSRGFDEKAYRESVRRIQGVLERAGVARYAIQPPGRATGLVAARRALEMWLDVTGLDPDGGGDVSIIDTHAAQKEMADILHAHQRVARRRASSVADGI